MERPEPSARPLLNIDRDESLPSRRNTPSGYPPYTESTASGKGFRSDIANLDRNETTTRSGIHHPMARTDSGWRRGPHFVRRIWIKNWTAETISFIMSILTLAGLVATLLAHEHRPLPQWPQLVNINSIISLFSLLMRSCVGVVLAEGISQCKWNWYQKARKLDHIERLDFASRSSWGSFILLCHFRPKRVYLLASFGAIITILASFTGFFSQQLVQFQDCLQQDTEVSASIFRTNSYMQTGGSSSNNVHVDYPPMVAAINVGVLQPVGDLTGALTTGCNSGNCTFSDSGDAAFSTLAISHHCNEITERIRIVNQTGEANETQRAYLGLDYRDYGSNKTFAWSRETGGLVLSTLVSAEYPTAFATIYFVFRQEWRDMEEAFKWRAVNCTMIPTINTYHASIHDAVLRETLTDIVPLQMLAAQFEEPPVTDLDYFQKANWYTHLMVTNSTLRDGRRVSCEGSERNATGLTYVMKSTSDPTYVNSTGHSNPSAGWKWWFYPNDCVWALHKNSLSVIYNTLDEVFGEKEVGTGLRGGVMGPAQPRAIFEEGNITLSTIDARMKNLTAAMTTVVRVHGRDQFIPSPYTGPVAGVTKGDVWINTTCVSIQWKWMAFPAVMIWLTGIFLILVAFDNRGVESDRLWKSSFLAAIFCDVEVHERPAGKEEMSAVARSTSVSLEGKSGRLRLVSG